MVLSSLRSLCAEISISRRSASTQRSRRSLRQRSTPSRRANFGITPDQEDFPGALEIRRRERSYVLAVPLFDIPHGSIVMAPASPAWADLLEPPPAPGEILRWTVDGFVGVERDHTRLRLVLTPEETT
jgi:hypothetical protein